MVDFARIVCNFVPVPCTKYQVHNKVVGFGGNDKGKKVSTTYEVRGHW